MELAWLNLPILEWRKLLAQADQSNIVQSWPYAKACYLHSQVVTRCGVLKRGETVVGLLQLQEARALGGMVGAATLDRGPLWLEGHGSDEDWRDFIGLFARTFPRRLGRGRRLMPELPDTPAARKLLDEAGLRRLGDGYESIELDLTRAIDTLKKDLRPNWRQHLDKAARSGLAIDIDLGLTHVPWLLAAYAADSEAKQYRGASPRFLETAAQEAASLGDLMVLRACEKAEPIAGAMIFCHGAAATYQVGVATARGRKLSGTNLLLWTAIAQLKEQGFRSFDLGGINRVGAAGVTAFKEGLGGRPVRLVGIYG